ncbi:MULTISPECIES: DJ-1 family glyoxalase III [unclassified Actinomyces]|uniref:DJ-1 family glyoxalase III n=1 Tax=unclassified Actinomyces TaxID=2609248 RepID=UPI002017909B|nr:MULTISPECIES: DJ-1 family glyoxalase III [unclassified Actinomyces]MCL3777645.1 DJ-1/PfpI family protein [Actinomyces sp. AC-20-1]MCL3790028.1 DJ-1/PfpI family protein [Actinomyces sp. 187325]MCL3792425.1 DJ-1/PfpI family protein [Actinomyces sp. 186855]MCL3794830.1 DJ-1/PfpI family protein [Actinomyces sp. 217892]
MPTPDTLATGKKVAVLVAPGLEEVEALAVVDVLYRAGVRTDLVAVADSLEVTSSHRVTFLADVLLADTDLAAYDLVLLPGGIPGTPNLRASQAVTREVRRRLEAGEPLAAICAAPSVPAELGLLRGRRATANPAFMQVLAEHGAEVSEEGVVVDGNLLTSRGMATATDLGLAVIEHLLDAEAADRVRTAIVYGSRLPS